MAYIVMVYAVMAYVVMAYVVVEFWRQQVCTALYSDPKYAQSSTLASTAGSSAKSSLARIDPKYSATPKRPTPLVWAFDNGTIPKNQQPDHGEPGLRLFSATSAGTLIRASECPNLQNRCNLCATIGR